MIKFYLDENITDAYINKAVTLSDLDRYDEANECINKAVSIDPVKEDDIKCNLIRANIA